MTTPAVGAVESKFLGIPSGWPRRVVSLVALVGLGAMVLLPLIESLPGSPDFRSGDWVRHLTLWVGLFGAFLASWKDRHLCIAVAEAVPSGRWKSRLDLLSRAGTIGILLCLTYASTKNMLILGGRENVVGPLPFWAVLLPMPLAFAGMALVTWLKAGEGWRRRMGMAALAILLGPALVFLPLGVEPLARVLGIGGLILLAGVGMPLFAALGGAALLLFFLAGGEATSVAYATYEISSATFLPSIPLFALAGVILARGGSPRRLVRFTQAWSGWVPGGASIATILACAFFTAISGASGVTILALGGLLFPVLVAAHHSERFSLGLLTASGSVGLLFPPSIPVILYAVKSNVPWEALYVAGLVPGLLLLLLLGGFSIYQLRRDPGERPPFVLGEALKATGLAIGDLILPVLVVSSIFLGWMPLVGTAALAAFWAILLEAGMHRTLDLREGLPGAFIETAFVVGALMAVIGMAFSFSEFLICDFVHIRITDWVTATVQSKWVFLLVLNLLLLAVGALMDIFSAIVIVVPLIAPVAEAYGIGPAHLGIIFLANLELGYLTPPVGLNLFLSSLTFDKPLLKVWRATLPFLAIFAGWVLLVTYVPWLSEGLGALFINP